MSETIFAVISVARQVDGEYVAIRTEKAFRQASSADRLIETIKKSHTGPDGKLTPVRLATPHGDIDCLCEVGAFEIELE